MLLRIALGVALWVVAAIVIRLGIVTPGVGAIMLLVAVLMPFGILLLRVLALALDIITGV